MTKQQIQYLSDITNELYLMDRTELENTIRNLINAAYDTDTQDQIINKYNELINESEDK